MTALESLKILLVEDSKTDAILIEKALMQASPNSYGVKRVENLAAALRLVSEEEFDVVLLDLSLPDTSGFNGLISIQNMSPALPVIILTAHEDEELALEAVKNGAQDYLFKDKVNSHAMKRAMQYAIQRKQFEGILITQANFDPLTGLANRVLFESRLDMALARNKRTGAGVGIFFLDLDHFKQVNDVQGHATGDNLLRQVADRLKQSIRPYDTAARFGGDEFALLIEGLEKASDCNSIAKKIIQRIGEPFILSGRQADIGVSIGIATCMAGDIPTRSSIMQEADEAMYSAKLVSDSAYVFYSDEIHKEALAKLNSQKPD